jgi:hypothetical protein
MGDSKENEERRGERQQFSQGYREEGGEHEERATAGAQRAAGGHPSIPHVEEEIAGDLRPEQVPVTLP